MSFPPPLRFLVPAILMVLGLAAIGLDYRGNLSNDLQRNFNEVVAQAEVTGKRLAKLASQDLGKKDVAGLKANLSAWQDEPWLKIAAVVDDKGTVIADSDGRWAGIPAKQTPAALALRMIRTLDSPSLQKVTKRAGEVMVSGAYALEAERADTAWLLVVFDRADAVAQARSDALQQLLWEGSVIGLFCLALWAALHFGVSARLTKLERAVNDLGSGKARVIEPLGGGDEVHALSEAFSDMSRQLVEREHDRMALEREVIDSTERERHRIGHELHDGIGQQLTASLMAINAVTDALKDPAPDFAQRCSQVGVQLRQTISEVRALSHGLAPVPMWESGLEHALQSLAESTTQSAGIRCVFECPDPVDVENQEKAGNLYRIAQEAVNNALKHAKAGEIRIGLEKRGELLVLEIDDDGEGMDEVAIKQGGIGLRVMRHRAESMHGTFSIGAAPAGGTRVCVQLPVSS